MINVITDDLMVVHMEVGRVTLWWALNSCFIHVL